MGRSIALLLAAAVAVGASAGAQAADFLPPPPPPPDGASAANGIQRLVFARRRRRRRQIELSSFASPFTNPTVPRSRARYQYGDYRQDTVFAGAGIGYPFNNWFRFDLTAEYRTAAHYRAIQSYINLSNLQCGALFYDLYHGHHGTAVFLANAYFDLGTWYGVTPFVGGGIGAA